MPYQFNFDLTRVSRFFFREITEAAHRSSVHRRLGEAAAHLLQRFRVQEMTGLDLAQALVLLEDLIDIQMKNLSNRERFLRTGRRVLFLPHCSRKHMDNRCKAVFKRDIPSYYCAHCSADCLVGQATLLGERKGYDVYVVPGGSCIHKILQEGHYDSLVGVACGDEIKLAEGILNKTGLPGQTVPLIKNGCANTKFSMQALREIL